MTSARSDNTITSINSIDRLLNVKFILLSSVLSCLMLNKPLLIMLLMIYLFIYFNIKKCIPPVVLSLEGNSGGAKKKKKTVSATNKLQTVLVRIIWKYVRNHYSKHQAGLSSSSHNCWPQATNSFCFWTTRKFSLLFQKWKLTKDTGFPGSL